MFRSPLIDGLVVIVVLLLIVGPKKLPQMGRGLGDGMREFKEGITGGANKQEEAEQPKVTLQPPPAPTAQPTSTADNRPAQSAAAPGPEAGSDRSV
jgi:sec-independent protein translocase protein TatA